MKRPALAVVALLLALPLAAQPTSAPHSATTPAHRLDSQGWAARHNAMADRIRQGVENADVGMLFIGNSITHGWEGEGRNVWNEYYAKRAAVNLGIGGDRTQHVLWRLDQYDLERFPRSTPPTDPAAEASASSRAPRVAVLMIGTNNSSGSDNTAEEIADGINAIVERLRADLPETKVLLLAIFPRGEPGPQREKNAKASALASKAADGKLVHYLDIGPKFLEPDGTLSRDIMPDLLHLSPQGYRIWAESMEPELKELLGER